jgi:hypothetical protein
VVGENTLITLRFKKVNMGKTEVEKLRYIEDEQSLKYYQSGSFLVEHGYMVCYKKGRPVGKATNWPKYR